MFGHYWLKFNGNLKAKTHFHLEGSVDYLSKSVNEQWPLRKTRATGFFHGNGGHLTLDDRRWRGIVDVRTGSADRARRQQMERKREHYGRKRINLSGHFTGHSYLGAREKGSPPEHPTSTDFHRRPPNSRRRSTDNCRKIPGKCQHFRSLYTISKYLLMTVPLTFDQQTAQQETYAAFTTQCCQRAEIYI